MLYLRIGWSNGVYPSTVFLFSFHTFHMSGRKRNKGRHKYLLLIMKNKRLPCLVPETPGGGLTGLGRGCPKGNKSGWPAPWEGNTCPTCKIAATCPPCSCRPPPSVSVQFTLPHFLPLSPSLHSHYVSAVLSRTLIAQEPELLHKDDYKMTPWGFFFWLKINKRSLLFPSYSTKETKITSSTTT